MPRRMYVYRRGTTDRCAVTAEKNVLPPASAADHWQFWMQIGPVQAQNGRFGFDIRAAVNAIVTDGYYLFVGSNTLLGRPVRRSSRHGSEESQSNV